MMGDNGERRKPRIDEVQGRTELNASEVLRKTSLAFGLKSIAFER